MYREIMVPLDGSQSAEHALVVADQLARLYRRRAVLGGVTLHLVRVMDPLLALPMGAYALGMQSVPTSALEDETAAAAANLVAVGDRLDAAGLRVRVSLLRGSTSAALFDYARSERIDLVVMCSQWRTGLTRLALGCVAERLVRLGQAPVLLVHPAGPPPQLDLAVVPLDGSEEAELALPVLRELSTNVVREATLLRVIDQPDQELPAMRYLSRVAVRPELAHLALRRLVVVGDPGQVIREMGSGKLVVLTRHRHRPRAPRLCSSVVDGVARGGEGAVLVAPRGAMPDGPLGRALTYDVRARESHEPVVC